MSWTEKLFGFALRPVETEEEKARNKRVQSPFPPLEDDGALLVVDNTSAYTSTFLDYGRIVQNEIELITKYRAMVNHPEVDKAVDQIVNQMIDFGADGMLVDVVTQDLDECGVSEGIRKRISEEFKHIYKMLQFALNGYNITRKWYVDGRLFFHILIDPENPKTGIQELRYIDPRKIKKVRKERKKATYAPFLPMQAKHEEFFLYNPLMMTSIEQGIKIAPDAIGYVHSGNFDDTGMIVLGQLHKALKVLNQLKWMEDALVIYRLVRAPERRVFKIDVEGIPPAKSGQYVQNIMNSHRNKIMYDTSTGEVDTEKRFLTLTDDYYIPVRSGKGTAIETLPGGENLGQIQDVEYFRNKLYEALNVPPSRMKADSIFSSGRSVEITNDEVLFQKFVHRQRNQFGTLFSALLRIQLVLKGVCSLADWEKWAPFLKYDFKRDSFFSELKENEVLQQRLEILGAIDPYVMKYFSPRYVRVNLLKQDDDEIKELKKERDTALKEEGDIFAPPPAMDQFGMNGLNGPEGFGGPPNMGGGVDPATGQPYNDYDDPQAQGQMPGGGDNVGVPFNKKRKPIGEMRMPLPKTITNDGLLLAETLKKHIDLSIGEAATAGRPQPIRI